MRGESWEGPTVRLPTGERQSPNRWGCQNPNGEGLAAGTARQRSCRRQRNRGSRARSEPACTRFLISKKNSRYN